MGIGGAGSCRRSFRSTRNALRRVAAANSRRSLERGNGPFGSEARRGGEHPVNASGTCCRGSRRPGNFPFGVASPSARGHGQVPGCLCPGVDSEFTTDVNSPLRRLSSLQVPGPFTGCSPRSGEPRTRRVRCRVRGQRLELAAATRRSALRVDRKKRLQLPAAPMPIPAPGEAGHPFGRFQKEGRPTSPWHLRRFRKEGRPGSPRHLAPGTPETPRHLLETPGTSHSLEPMGFCRDLIR